MNELSRRLAQRRAFLEADPDNLPLLLDTAELHYLTGEFEAALALLEQAMQLSPAYTQALSLRGIILLAQGQAEHAAMDFRQLIAQGHEAVELHYNLAYALLTIGKPEEAEPFAQQAATDVATLPAAGPLYLRVLHHNAKVEEAIQFAEATLAQYPDHLPLYGSLSTLYLDQGDLEKAATFAKSVLLHSPDDADALVVLGTEALARQDALSALPLFQHAASQRPHSGRSWVGIGLADMLGGDLKQAESHLREAVKHMPSHIGTWHALGWCQLFQEDLSGAQATFEHALTLDRRFADSHGGLAVIAAMRGEHETAQRACRKALGLDPNCFSGQFAQSLLLQATGQADQANQIVQSLLQEAVLPDGTSLQGAVVQLLQQQQATRPD